MTFNPQNLSVLAYANGFTLWHYRTDDEETEVLRGGYFNDSSHMLNAGDMILTNLTAGPKPRGAILLVESFPWISVSEIGAPLDVSLKIGGTI